MLKVTERQAEANEGWDRLLLPQLPEYPGHSLLGIFLVYFCVEFILLSSLGFSLLLI